MKASIKLFKSYGILQLSIYAGTDTDYISRKKIYFFGIILFVWTIQVAFEKK